MISLKEKVAVYVNDAQIAVHVGDLLAHKFGGASSLLGTGWWVGNGGETEVESLYYVFSYAARITEKDLEEIVEKLKTWLGDQESIAVELNGKLFLFSPKESDIVID